MYNSLNNGDCFQKPKFDYKTYMTEALMQPIQAPDDVFKPKITSKDSSEDDDDEDNGLDMPHTFRSRTEGRIYLGRGYNRLGLQKLK